MIVKYGAQLGALTDAADAHVAAELISRWGDVKGEEAAYANSTLVCLMWNFMRRKATKLGYKPFGKVKC